MFSLKLRQILALFAFSSLSACAPAAMQGEDNPGGTTGYTDPRGAPYTVGGDRRLVDPKPGPAPTPADTQLATKITGVKLYRLGPDAKIDRLGKSGVRLILTLDKGETLNFEGAMTSTTAGRYQSKAIMTSDKTYSLEVDFTDDSTRQESSGQLLIKKLDKKGKALAQVTIYTRAYEAKVHSIPSNEQQLNNLNKAILRLVTEKPRAWVANVVVEKARSFYEVHVFADPKEKPKPQDKSKTENSKKPGTIEEEAAGRRLFSFGGEAKRTGDFVPVDATATAGVLKPLQVQMIGDAEILDQRTFSLLIEGQENQNIDVALKVEHQEPKQEDPPPAGARGVQKNNFFQVQYKNPRLPNVTKTIDAFERNFQLPEVQTWIERYTTKAQMKNALELLLEKMAPMREIIAAVFHYGDVAPPAALVTVLESPNYYLKNYLIETNPGGTATGPFQLVKDSASKMGMNVTKSQSNGAKPPEWDERNYFVPSACGAARHFRNSLNQFINTDPTLILLAYHMGDGGVSAALKKTSAISKYGLSYRDIATQRIVKSEYTTYVAKALALYFVTGNPTLYKLNFPQSPARPPLAKMIPPKGINDTQCFMAVSKARVLNPQKL